MHFSQFQFMVLSHDFLICSCWCVSPNDGPVYRRTESTNAILDFLLSRKPALPVSSSSSASSSSFTSSPSSSSASALRELEIDDWWWDADACATLDAAPAPFSASMSIPALTRLTMRRPLNASPRTLSSLLRRLLLRSRPAVPLPFLPSRAHNGQMPGSGRDIDLKDPTIGSIQSLALDGVMLSRDVLETLVGGVTALESLSIVNCQWISPMISSPVSSSSSSPSSTSTHARFAPSFASAAESNIPSSSSLIESDLIVVLVRAAVLAPNVTALDLSGVHLQPVRDAMRVCVEMPPNIRPPDLI
jgi:hypothetical protein